MNEKELKAISAIFYFSSAYDLVLGVIFLLVAPWFFRVFVVEPPNHWGYIHFPAMMLILFGIMFFQIAENPRSNRNLIPYGCLLKASYCFVVAFHTFLSGSMPDMWKPFGIADFMMLLGFLWAYKKLAPGSKTTPSNDSSEKVPT